MPDDSTPTSLANLLTIDSSSVGGSQLTAAVESTTTIPGLNQNALGITADGLAAYATSDAGTTIQRYDAVNGTWAAFPGRTPPGSTITSGAVDPTTGIYYFGYGGTGEGEANLWGFDTVTNQMISDTPLLTFDSPPGQGSGDIAFDGSGDLYIVNSSTTDATLTAIPAPLPRTAADATTFQPKTLSTFAVPGGVAVNGIAFDGTGTLYLSEGGTNGIFAVDPGTGTARGSLTPLPAALTGTTGRGLTDLASCAFPPAIKAQKYVTARAHPTDQFTLQITGPTVSFPATATTVGTATGEQKTASGQVLQAGPALGRLGDTYTVTETAAGTTNLAEYLTTYRCDDVAHPDNPDFPVTGTGTTVSLQLNAFTDEAPSVLCTFTNAARAPALTLTKTASPTTFTAPGETITYTYTVENTGNTALSALGVTETTFTGSGTPPVPNCPTTTLAPAETTQCTASYTVTAADMTAGSITNTATASAHDAILGSVTSPEARAVATLEPMPALTLSMSVSPAPLTSVGSAPSTSMSPAAATEPGQLVTYSFLIRNSGNVPLTGVAITQTAFTGTGPLPAVTCGADAASLAPGDSTICTAPYELTAHDIDTGNIENTAIAAGSGPSDSRIESTSSTVTLSIQSEPSLTLDKTADPTAISAAGEEIVYSFRLSNTGNVTLTDLAIAELHFSGTGGPLTVTCPVEQLASGDSVTCTADYHATDADYTSGSIVNTATASAIDPAGATVDAAESSATVDVNPVIVPAPPAEPPLVESPLADTGNAIAMWLISLAGVATLSGAALALVTARRRFSK